MLEDDPNVNAPSQRNDAETKHKWGPKHKGAQKLAQFYSRGEFKQRAAADDTSHDIHKMNELLRNMQVRVDVVDEKVGLLDD